MAGIGSERRAKRTEDRQERTEERREERGQERQRGTGIDRNIHIYTRKNRGENDRAIDMSANAAVTGTLTRALFRGMNRMVGMLNVQVKRHGDVASCINDRDAATIFKYTGLTDVDNKKTVTAKKSLSAALSKMIADDGEALRTFIKLTFRKKTATKDNDIFTKINYGMNLLASLNNKVALLGKMATEPRSEFVTEGIRVIVKSQLLETSSNVASNDYCFAYRVSIINDSSQTVTVLKRKWVIIDDEGSRQVVTGMGVVGKQPEIPTGEMFEYMSAAHLKSIKGSMEGYYEVKKADGGTIQVKVAPFALRSPKSVPFRSSSISSRDFT